MLLFSKELRAAFCTFYASLALLDFILDGGLSFRLRQLNIYQWKNLENKLQQIKNSPLQN